MIAELGTQSKQGFWQSVSGVQIAFGALAGAILGHPKVSF